MTNKEIFAHIVEDEELTKPFVERRMKAISRYLRGFQSRRKSFASMDEWTSHRSKQKYWFLFISNNKEIRGGVFYIQIAVTGMGTERRYHLSNCGEYLTSITPHFLARYVERMHLDADTDAKDVIKTIFTRNSFITAIYTDGNRIMEACNDGIIFCTKEDDDSTMMRTFVSMDMLGKSQRKAVEKVLDRLNPSFSKISRSVRNGKDIKDAYDEAHAALDILADEACEIYKQYFKRQ